MFRVYCSCPGASAMSTRYNARDIAKIFALGIEELGIDSVFSVIGGSVGGGIAWELEH
mgnify:CR=1 FL=1